MGSDNPRIDTARARTRKAEQDIMEILSALLDSNGVRFEGMDVDTVTSMSGHVRVIGIRLRTSL